MTAGNLFYLKGDLGIHSAILKLCVEDPRFAFDQSRTIWCREVTPNELEELLNSGQRGTGIFSFEYIQSGTDEIKGEFIDGNGMRWLGAIPRSFERLSYVRRFSSSEIDCGNAGEIATMTCEICKPPQSERTFSVYDRGGF